MATVNTFVVKTRDDIRDDYLRTLRNALINRGVANPNVGPKTDEYQRALGFANELVVVESNGVVQSDALMPDTATGSNLDDWLAAVGLARRTDAGSVGFIVANVSAASLVAVGSQLLDGAGLRFQVTVGGVYNNGDLIPVAAVDTGVATNHIAGDTLTWVGTAPPYSAPTALVATGGLVDGIDTEDDETARSRLLSRIQNPPGAGNWQQVAEFAEGADPRVQKAFVYPAAGGPATVHVAVVTYASSTSRNRDLASTILSSIVTPSVAGQIAEHADLTCTTVTNQSTDVAIGLTLPSAPSASPPGPGGGWIDGAPWPSVDGSSYFFAQVDFGVVAAPASTTQFTVIAMTPPTPGVSHICWVNPSTWTLYRAKVLTLVSSTTVGGLNYYTITIDSPFVGLPSLSAFQFIFPDAANMAAYVQAALDAFAAMGPGEKSSNPSVLARGFRHPVPQLSWPYSLGATQLRRISDVGEEVLSTSWIYRSSTTPSVPGSVTSAPSILVPHALAFYPIPS